MSSDEVQSMNKGESEKDEGCSKKTHYPKFLDTDLSSGRSEVMHRDEV